MDIDHRFGSTIQVGVKKSVSSRLQVRVSNTAWYKQGRTPGVSSVLWENSRFLPAASFPRICHCEGDEESPLITPCRCTGTLRFVHQSCLHQWIKSSDTRCCELCKYDFIMETKLKPLRKVRCGGGQEGDAGRTVLSRLALRLNFLLDKILPTY